MSFSRCTGSTDDFPVEHRENSVDFASTKLGTDLCFFFTHQVETSTS